MRDRAGQLSNSRLSGASPAHMEEDVQSNVSTVLSADSGKAISLEAGTPIEAGPSAYESAVATAADEVLLHVRFWPDSRVWEIAERPDHLGKEEWYKLLISRAANKYFTRANSRGFFRLTRLELEALKAKNPN